MATRIPRIEIADHRHALGVGRPHREAHALHAVDRDEVGAQCLGQLEMPAFIEQVQIELAQQRAEGIGIFGFLHRGGPLDAQEIGRGVGHGAFEQARHLVFPQPAERRSIAATQHVDRLRPRQEDANDASGRAVMRTQHPEGVAMAGRRQRFGVGTIQPSECRCRHGLAPGADARRRLAMRARPPTGMASQVGRLAAS